MARSRPLSKPHEIIIKLRAHTDDDLGFIYNSWLKSFRREVRKLSRDSYFKAQGAVIDDIMKRSSVVVACAKEDNTHIYGYAVYELLDGQPVIYWIYVKDPYRNNGIGGELVHYVTNKTDRVLVITHINSKLRGLLKYRPFVVKRNWRPSNEASTSAVGEIRPSGEDRH